MIRKTKPHKYNYGRSQEPLPKEEPVSSRMGRARQLPNSGPGVAVTVKLDVLPEYLELHGLEPILTDFPRIMPADVPLVVMVRRIKKDGKPT